ncbi:hypothetical protein [Actinomadura sp. 3N407]|uniref:hypothetical protein n=1 Tax=Actinomadura sp. 3N407 TaxID=3457423 RepID=UPI003FCDE4AD
MPPKRIGDRERPEGTAPPQASQRAKSPAKPGRATAPAAPAAKAGTAAAGRTAELRVYLLLESLRRQFAAYLGTPTRGRGYPPLEGDHALIVEVAPGLAIERVTDLAVKSVPEIEVGLLFVERQFGILEVHAGSLAKVMESGEAILAGIGASGSAQLRPRILYSDIIENITDQHAVIANRNRQASMVMPGQHLLVFEMAPALFAAVAANAAEAVAPDNTLVDVQMIGAAGRVYIAGAAEGVARARDEIERVLLSIEGRD